jgi:hypothetical protein
MRLVQREVHACASRRTGAMARTLAAGHGSDGGIEQAGND